jgi:hypothetical protein
MSSPDVPTRPSPVPAHCGHPPYLQGGMHEKDETEKRVSHRSSAARVNGLHRWFYVLRQLGSRVAPEGLGLTLAPSSSIWASLQR